MRDTIQYIKYEAQQAPISVKYLAGKINVSGSAGGINIPNTLTCVDLSTFT